MIEEFISYQRVYRGVSEERLTRTRRVLTALAERAGDPLQATRDDLERFLLDVLEEVSPSTADQYLKIIRAFHRWAWERGHLDADSYLRLRTVRAPRFQRSKPNPYTRTEIARLRRELADRYPLASDYAVNRFFNGTTKSWRRMYRHAHRLQWEAIIALALELGLRRIEICRLSVDDLHYDNEFIVVHGKGDKYREVPFTHSARMAVARWLELRTRLAPAHDRPWVWLRAPRRLDPLEPIELSEGFSRLGSGWSLHRLRHTCATERLRARMPIDQVQRLLGHATIQQTLAYAEIARPDLARHLEQSEEAFSTAVGSSTLERIA